MTDPETSMSTDSQRGVAAPTATAKVKCSYCKRLCSGKHRDALGEFRLNRPLPICKRCKRHFDDEPFDHEDWK